MNSTDSLDLIPPPRYPQQAGSGERLKTFLAQLLPALLGDLTANQSPMVAMALNSVPTLLARHEFTDEQAVAILEKMDDLTVQGFRDVLGVQPE